MVIVDAKQLCLLSTPLMMAKRSSRASKSWKPLSTSTWFFRRMYAVNAHCPPSFYSALNPASLAQ